MAFARLGALTLVVTVFAGCTDPASTLMANEATHSHSEAPEWSVDFTQCEEGGFVASSYQAGSNWVRRDIRPEVGPEYP